MDNWGGNPDDCLGPIARAIGKEKAQATFLRNVRGFLGRPIIPLFGNSVEVAAFLASEDTQLDIVFIDARHDYTSVTTDIRVWGPLVRPGGILCGHDYAPYFPDVIRAVTDWFPFEHSVIGHSIWMVRLGTSRTAVKFPRET